MLNEKKDRMPWEIRPHLYETYQGRAVTILGAELGFKGW